MKALITGSSGHLGEALVRTLRDAGHAVIGLDVIEASFTDAVGSITDRAFLRQCLVGVDALVHTATLHKPHVVTHSRQDFVDTNITGTLNLLEEAVAAGVSAFVFTSTTSTFGCALNPSPDEPAVWVTEDLRPIPKNIYGVTKTAAEGLCALFYRLHALPSLVLKTSRFFPEEDDNAAISNEYADANVKANEYLYRRVDMQDVVDAHLLAISKAPQIGFGRYIISATTPFARQDVAELRMDAPAVLQRRVPDYEAVYAKRGWRMFPAIDRVYDNSRARRALGWQPRYDFQHVIDCLQAGKDPRSRLARIIGSKGYHEEVFADGPFPVA